MTIGKRINVDRSTVVSSQVAEQISAIIDNTFHGNIVLVVQDYQLIQIDRNEKIRPVTHGNLAKKNTITQKGINSNLMWTSIESALLQLAYGQVVVVVKQGKIVQIERTEKKRVPGLMEGDGDGI